MKNSKLLLALASGVLLANVAFAASPFEKHLKNLRYFSGGNGRSACTYEDISGVRLNPFLEENKQYPMISEEEIPEGYVSKAAASKIFKKFKNHAIITGDKTSYFDFFNDHVSLESKDVCIYSFPASLGDISRDPGILSFNLKVDDDYTYISSFREYSPDALSCTAAPDLCSDKCRVKSVTTKLKPSSHRRFWADDDGYSGNGYPFERTKTEEKKVHVFGANNIYSNFRDTIMAKAKIEEANAITVNDYIKLEFEDRTPPYIVGGYTMLGGDIGDYACTSGDFYKTEGFELADNNPEVLDVMGKFAFGRLAGQFPQEGEPWESCEDWRSVENIKNVNLKSQKVYYNGKQKKVIDGFEDVVNFHNFAGVIRYSVFLKEGNKVGNTNPGVNRILQDVPEEGYGYKGAGDLGNTLETAKPWPDKRELGEILGRGQDTNYIRVFDNDRPNIAIRITEVETGRQMFFPPLFPAGQFTVTNSKKYKAEAGIDKSNQDDYDLFVKDLPAEFDYSKLSAYPQGIPYYTILSLNDQSLGIASDSLPVSIRKMLNNNDVNFINQNVRLENYFFSDTLRSGEPTYAFKNDELGKRRGTMRNMVALFENSSLFTFKEGVEYKLDVWTDDNIKWTNIKPVNHENPDIQHFSKDGDYVVNRPEILDYAITYYTGVKEGVIKLTIPNESENLSREEEIDIQKSINGGISFVLKDTTPAIRNIDSVELAEKYGFPSIYVSATDYEGFTRELKLYFRVGDKKLNMRVLEPEK